MPKNEYECNVCTKSFDTERGLSVHRTKMHHKTGMKKTRLVVMELIKKGKKSVRGIAHELGWNDENVERFLNKLVDEDYLNKKMIEGEKAFYSVTDKGDKEIRALMKDIASETKEFLSALKDSFEEHLGHSLPEVTVEWKDEE